MAGAHENINNLIVANTLQEIAHGQDLGGGSILYEVTTKGGDPRFIHQMSSSLPTKELREIYYHNLLGELTKSGGAYPDTLAAKQVPDVLEGMQRADSPNILMRLVDSIKGLF